jgi:glycosidase
MTVAEIWDVSELVAPYVGEEVDLAFEFSLAKSILESVNEGRVTPVASAMKEVRRLYPPGGYASFLANHDQNRVMDVVTRDPAKAKLAATLLFTLPGVPFVYYGEEIGMTGSKPDELIRTPMQWSPEPHAGFTSGIPWQPVNEGHQALNVELQSSDPDSLLNHYRALISVRQENPALAGGDYVQVQSEDSRVYAFLRISEGERLLVVVNMRPNPVMDYALTLRKSPLPTGGYEAVDLLTGMEADPLTVDVDGTFRDYLPLPELAAQSALVLDLTPGP